MNKRFMEALRYGAIDPDHAARYHGGGKGAPPAPDYTGAANAQGAASQAIATQNTWANRPNVYTPFGNQTWSAAAGTDPATGQAVTNWNQYTTLGPEEQASLDAQNRISAGRSGAAETLLGQATGAFQSPFDWNKMPTAPNVAAYGTDFGAAQKDAYEKMTAMQEPGRTRQRDALDTKLANSGLSRDSEAFKRSQQDLSDQFTQADKTTMAQAMQEGRANEGQRQSEALAANNQQSTLRQQAIAEEAQRRGMTLNELNSLLTGQQVSMPNMPSFNAATKADAPNYLGAAQMQGQYGLDAMNSGTDWGSMLGSAAGTAAKIYMSDARLKSNIRRIGTHPRGVGIYSYTIFGRDDIGVMAQELLHVAPHLVITTPSGYLAVNYAGL